MSQGAPKSPMKRRKQMNRGTPLRAKEGPCLCGCGQPAGVYVKTAVRGKPRWYIHGHHGRKRIRYTEEDHGFETSCWIWQLALDLDGYAQVGRGRSRRAARRYWEERNGPIPDGLVGPSDG